MFKFQAAKWSRANLDHLLQILATESHLVNIGDVCELHESVSLRNRDVIAVWVSKLKNNDLKEKVIDNLLNL